MSFSSNSGAEFEGDLESRPNRYANSIDRHPTRSSPMRNSGNRTSFTSYPRTTQTHFRDNNEDDDDEEEIDFGTDIRNNADDKETQDYHNGHPVVRQNGSRPYFDSISERFKDEILLDDTDDDGLDKEYINGSSPSRDGLMRNGITRRAFQRAKHCRVVFWSLVLFSVGCVLLSALSYMHLVPSNNNNDNHNTKDLADPTFDTGTGGVENEVPEDDNNVNDGADTDGTNDNNPVDDTGDSNPVDDSGNAPDDSGSPAEDNTPDDSGNTPDDNAPDDNTPDDSGNTPDGNTPDGNNTPPAQPHLHSWKVRGRDVTGVVGGQFLGATVVLSRDGTVMAVGSPGANDNMGMVQTYQFLDDISWRNYGEPIEGVGQFGISIDLDTYGRVLAVGGTLAAGPEGGSSTSTATGHVRVFEFNVASDEWKALGEPLYGDEDFENMGWAVALSGDGKKLAVGSPAYQNHKGRVQVYDWHEKKWQMLGPQIAPDRQHGIGYGVSFSQDGNHLAIVSNGDPHKEPHSVQVFGRHNHTHWTSMGDPLTDIGDEVDNLGQRIHLSGDAKTLAVAARFKGQDQVGYTQVYKFHKKMWNEWGDRFDAKPDPNDTDGGLHNEHTALSMNHDGSILAIGSPHDAEKGCVRVFSIPSDGNGQLDWTPIGDELLGPTGFGGTVTLSGDGNTLAVGASKYDYDKGMVRVFLKRHIVIDEDGNERYADGDDGSF